jgi:DNA-binding transcriptional LysR family regulator
MLRDGAADIGVLPSGNYEGLNTRPLCSAHLYAAVPAVGGWAARKSVPVNPAPDSRLLLSCPQTSVVAGLFKRTLSGTSGRQARVSHFGGGRQVLLDAVAAQLGVAWMLLFEESGDSLARMLPAQVVLKPVSGLPVKIPFCLAVRKGRPAGGAVEFVLREVLRHFRRA